MRTQETTVCNLELCVISAYKPGNFEAKISIYIHIQLWLRMDHIPGAGNWITVITAGFISEQGCPVAIRWLCAKCTFGPSLVVGARSGPGRCTALATPYIHRSPAPSASQLSCRVESAAAARCIVLRCVEMRRDSASAEDDSQWVADRGSHIGRNSANWASFWSCLRSKRTSWRQ